ncbi:MAG TPA: MobF family relaxase [Solirubrobacterales bacterium]|nr:MobF family relaxase [Solirubrobacterales bacterium]
MVGVTKIQRGNAGYWLAAVAEGGEDYYTKPGEAPGEWVGELADELGLHGQVDAAGYGAILEGRNPHDGATLIARPDTRFRERPDGTQKRVEPVLGYDVRFSAPKSVSLLYAFGSEQVRERIVAVMNEAVKEGIAHLEQHACMVQRGKGGGRIEPGLGFAGMAFRHRMSRAGDIALHVHVVISNLTRAASDGKWLSLASPRGRSPLFPHAKSAGVVFQAALRAGILREFGLEFQPVKNGYADLKGFSRELIDTFSTRAREITDWMERHGVFTVAAAQTAAYRTRKAKEQGVDVDARLIEWEDQAAPLGFTRQSVEEMVREGHPREPRPIEGDDLDRAVQGLEATSSHFDSRAALWALADQLQEGGDRREIEAAVSKLLDGDQVLRIHAGTGPLDPDAYSTPRIVALEKDFIDGALSSRDAGVGVVDAEIVNATLARHDYLGADQREMLIRLTTGGEQVIAVSALPGTGKTVALSASVEAWRDAGYTVIGCATARNATGELIDAGVLPSFSIRKLLLEVDRLRGEGRRLPDRTIIVLDEANVTDTPDLAELHRLAAGCGGKMAMIGDAQQIGAIGPGGLFAHYCRVSDPIRLTEIRRQIHEPDRRIVRLIHEGRGSDALDLLRAEGKLVIGEDTISTLHGLLLDWHRDYLSGADVVMIARRNRDVTYLNETAREMRREEGRLGEAEVIVGERPLAAGDRVQTRINFNNPKVDNRERWDVIDADAAARTLTLQRVGGDGREVTLGPAYLDRRTKDGAAAVDYSYAITKFGAESKTYDRAYPFLDGASSLEEELVALSRGREFANVYTVASADLLDPDLGPARREIHDALQDARQAIEREGADTPATEAALRAQIEAMSPSRLAERRAELAEVARSADPLLSRRDSLDREISRDREWLKTLAAEREATERIGTGPAGEVSQLIAKEASTVERLNRNIAERDGLPASSRAAEPNPTHPTERLEAALVERRIGVLARKEVTAGRHSESHVLYRSLGPFPEDEAARGVWNEAAHSLATYRIRHNVQDRENVLGHPPRSPEVHAERSRVQKRIEVAQRRLQRTRRDSAERPVGREASIGR